MAYIMQGDEYGIQIFLEREDGTEITPADVEDVEITIGNHRKTYANEEVSYDGEAWVFPLTQAMSFAFRSKVRCQVRVKFSGGDVIGRFLQNVDVETSDSRVTL